MLRNNYGGIFIVFDGPNGVGKTTLINQISDRLTNEGYKVRTTKEPSKSVLGNFTRKESENIDGDALACLVAANRYEHLEKDVIPSLKNNEIVICDRYVLSSLILQRMDNVTEEFIVNINGNIIIPDIQIALFASVDVIQSRLKERKMLSRFEERDKTVLELNFLNIGIEYLKKKGFDIYSFNTENEIKDNTKKIFDVIQKHINETGKRDFLI